MRKGASPNFGAEEGLPVRKKISSSLIEPTLLGYQNAFAQNATEIGWLDVTEDKRSKGGAEPVWERRWFELKDGVIRHAASDKPEDMYASVSIPIENIIRLVTGNKRRRPSWKLTDAHIEGGQDDESPTPQHLITMKTTHEKLILRTESADDLNRWVFAFQKSVALAMTKIMMAQANSFMHHKLGMDDPVSRQHDAEEALFLKEAADNDDDGWETHRRNRARNIIAGHASVIAAGKGLQRKSSRSMSIDESMLPQNELVQQLSVADAVKIRAYKDRSFGDLTSIKDEPTISKDNVDCSTPTKVFWGQNQAGSTDISSVESSPRAPGRGCSVFPDVSRHTSGSSTAEARELNHSSESINSTWRSVDDMSAYGMENAYGGTQILSGGENKHSPSSYSVGRTRALSACSGSSESGGDSHNISGGSLGSGSGSLRGEHISLGVPTRERSLSNVSGLSGGGRVPRISEDEDLDMDDNDNGDDNGDAGYMFNMEDMDSLENSLEDFNGFGYLSGSKHGHHEGGQSPLSSYLNKASSLRVEFGACTMLGPKSKQEDRFVMIPNLSTPSKRGLDVEGFDDESNTHRCENAYAAVYDGHCGFEASEFVNETLHNMVYEHPFYDTDIELAIRECCASIDKTFLERARREDRYDGTTAIGVFFHPKISQSSKTQSKEIVFPSTKSVIDATPEHDVGLLHHQLSGTTREEIIRKSDCRMTIFNIGDSGAVLCRDGVAYSLNDAHCPDRPDETERIEQAKGWITEEKELFVGRLHRMDLNDPDIAEQAASGIQWTTIHRVLGEVSVSRSIGDYPYKGFVPGEVVTDFFAWPENHDMTFNADLVISDPESKHVDIDELCEFVIIASDGLWDVVSNEKAVARVKAAFKAGESPKTAAEALCNLALKLGSGDNTTVLVVQLYHNMKGL